MKKKMNDGDSPSSFCKKLEFKKKYGRKLKPRKLKFKSNRGKDENYGDACQKPDIDSVRYELEKRKFLENLDKTDEEIRLIEETTRSQSDCDLWHLERRKRITASNFAAVCVKFGERSNGNTNKLVESILYPKVIEARSLEWGKSHEKDAINELEKVIGKKIISCGLFIDQNDKFLAATPDGLVAEEGLVEVKCPYSARDLTPDEAIFRRKVTFWKQNGEINETHKWFYQIQGQMMVTRRKYCCFAIWTPKGIKQEVIFKDEEFCIRMRNKLCEFYLKCCLPELIDPRKSRNMEIRNISVKKKEE